MYIYFGQLSELFYAVNTICVWKIHCFIDLNIAFKHVYLCMFFHLTYISELHSFFTSALVPLSVVVIGVIIFSRRWDFKELILIFKFHWLEKDLYLDIFLNFHLNLPAICRRNVHAECIPEWKLKYCSSIFCFALF